MFRGSKIISYLNGPTSRTSEIWIRDIRSHRKGTMITTIEQDPYHCYQETSLYPVWVETRGHQVPARVLHAARTPRSYVVVTPSGQLRRNCSHLRIRSDLDSTSNESTNMPSRVTTHSQTGITIRPPDHLRY